MGAIGRRAMIPLTSCGRFRKEMEWAAKAMHAIGVPGLGRQYFRSAPVVQNLVTVI